MISARVAPSAGQRRRDAVPLGLDIGEPRVPLPVHVLSTLIATIDSDLSTYSPEAGLGALRETLVEREKQVGNVIDERWVAITHGASAALSSSILALTAPGDRVMIPDPGYPAFRTLVEAFGRRPVSYPAVTKTLDGLEAILDSSPCPTLMIWNNPSNPTGAIAAKDLCAGLSDVARARGVGILSDEVYRDFVFGGAGHHTLVPRSDPPIARVHSLSKSLAIPGARIGYVVASPEIVERIARFHWRLNMSVATLEQRLATLLLGAAAEVTAHVRMVIEERRDLALERLRTGWPDLVAPDAGLFFWLDVRATGLSGSQFADLCRVELGVLVAPGGIFGHAGSGFIRVSYGAETATVDSGARRLAKLYERLAR